MPRHAIHSGRCLSFQAVVALPQQFDRHMVQQGGELQLPVLPCGFAHTLQPAWPAFPARCPARVRLWRVLLGPRPSLRNLRRRLPAFVRLLRRYYAVVRLPLAVHEGLAAHRVLPPARRVFSTGSHGVSRFSRMEFLRMPGVFDSAGPSAVSRWRPPSCCLPTALTASAPGISWISELNTLPTDAPLQRFKCGLTTALAWLGARVARYAFPVRLFHSLLHAGLSRRSLPRSATGNPPPVPPAPLSPGCPQYSWQSCAIQLRLVPSGRSSPLARTALPCGPRADSPAARSILSENTKGAMARPSAIATREHGWP